MITVTIITAILSILFVSNATASERIDTDRIDIRDSEMVMIKKSIIVAIEGKINDVKIVYERNGNDQLLDKVVYLQGKNGEWTPFQKYQYSYSTDEANTPSSLLYTQWRPQLGEWSRSTLVLY